MVQFADIVQSIIAPQLEIAGVERDPSYVGGYNVSNTVQRGLANILGVDGQWSRLIGCDADSNLFAGIRFGALQAEVLLPSAPGLTKNALHVSDYYTKALHAILQDVYEAPTHSLNVVVIP